MASMREGWSEPRLTKQCDIPASERASKKAVDAVYILRADAKLNDEGLEKAAALRIGVCCRCRIAAHACRDSTPRIVPADRGTVCVEAPMRVSVYIYMYSTMAGRMMKVGSRRRAGKWAAAGWHL